MPSLPARTLPDLPAAFMPPASWQDGAFVHEGRLLAHGYALPAGTPRGAVVILPGRAEFREKYFEVMHDLLARDLAVFCMDWFGQGSSGRHTRNSHKDHSRGFHHHVADLNAYIRDALTPTLHRHGFGNTPLLMLAHSMGGHLGLRYLATLQQSFAGAVLCSPMMGIHGVSDKPAWLTAGLTAALTPLHSFYAPLIWRGNWEEAACKPPGQDVLSSDPLRDSIQRQWFAANPHLQLGAPTWGWLHHALASCASLNNIDLLKNITLPTLFITAGDDTVVDNAGTLALAAHIPGTRHINIPGARHEIMMERDELRGALFNHFDNFLPACNIG